MSQPPTLASRQVQIVLLLFVLMPCLPGMVFLLVGLVTDPHLRARDPSPAGVAQYADAWGRTRGLYLAGGGVLIVGTLGTAVVVWKIARIGRYADEEEAMEGQAP